MMMNKTLRADMLRTAMEAADARDRAPPEDEMIVVAEEPEARPLVEEEAPLVCDQCELDLDAAFADAIEIVARARARNGRRVCSRHDGGVARRIFALLRAVRGPEGGADDDPSFQ